MKTLFWLALFLSVPANASTDTWQGEWGKWEEKDARTIVGEHFSIHDCDAKSHRCQVEYKAIEPPGAASFSGELEFRSDTDATITVVSDEGKKEDCRVILSRTSEGGAMFLSAKLEGKKCKFYNVYDIAPRFPLIQRARLFGLKEPRCFLTLTSASRAWCESPDIQSRENKLGEVWDREASLKGGMAVSLDWVREWRKNTWKKCDSSPAPLECFEKEISAEMTEAEKSIKSSETDYEVNGPAEEAKALMSKLEGVFKHRFENGRMDGSKYFSEDIFEFVRVADGVGYFKIYLNFANGHSCSIHGIAEFKKVGGFVYQDTAPTSPAERCRLTIKTNGAAIEFVDANDRCREGHCGMRGSFATLGTPYFKLSQRRKIKYLPRILKSADYLQSVKRYEEGKK